MHRISSQFHALFLLVKSHACSQSLLTYHLLCASLPHTRPSQGQMMPFSRLTQSHVHLSSTAVNVLHEDRPRIRFSLSHTCLKPSRQSLSLSHCPSQCPARCLARSRCSVNVLEMNSIYLLGRKSWNLFRKAFQIKLQGSRMDQNLRNHQWVVVTVPNKKPQTDICE